MEQKPGIVEDTYKIQVSVQFEDRERELVGKLVKKGLLELRPTLDKLGVHYVEAEETWKNTDPNQIKSMLKNLEKKGIIQPVFVDRVLTCPDCTSPEVYSKYACPKCKSTNVEYTELIEHMKCGYIGSIDRSIKDSLLLCPNCQTQLTVEALQFRVIGNCYQCEKCGYRFDKPQIVHFCQKCGGNFSYPEAKYIKIFAYKITEEALNNFRKDQPILEDIKKTLTDKGFQVRLHPHITGGSGVEHSFDLLAEKNEIRIVIDVSTTGSKNDMISLLGKKIDVNPTKTLIFDLSNLNELTSLEKVYDITVFKAQNTLSLQDQLENFLEMLQSTKPKTRLKAQS